MQRSLAFTAFRQHSHIISYHAIIPIDFIFMGAEYKKNPKTRIAFYQVAFLAIFEMLI